MIDPTSIALIFMFIIPSCLGVNQLHRVLNSKNNKFSLRSGILLFLTLGSLLRILFWVKASTTAEWPNQFMALLYFIPVWMQFCGYSLLLVFYAAALSDTRSREPMRYAVIINSLFLVLCVTISLLLKDPSASSEEKNIIEIIYFSYGALLDAIMTIGLSYFGYKFSRKQSANRKKVATRILPRSPVVFLYVNCLLVTSTLFRGCINISIAIVRRDKLGLIYYDSKGDRDPTPYYVALYFLFVEIIPAVCIFITLWKRLGKKKSSSQLTGNEAERVANHSIEERSGIVVRYTPDTRTNSKMGPPAWWSNFVDSMVAPSSSSSVVDGPAMDDVASDDDYMMFKEVLVAPGSATGDAVQISQITRNKILLNPEMSGSPMHAPVVGMHQVATGSPLVAASGTPPSFDIWTRQQQRGNCDGSNSSYLSTGVGSGSPISAQYLYASDSPLPCPNQPSALVRPFPEPATRNPQIYQVGGKTEHDSFSLRSSEDQTNQYDDALSPRDILLAQRQLQNSP